MQRKDHSIGTSESGLSVKERPPVGTYGDRQRIGEHTSYVSNFLVKEDKEYPIKIQSHSRILKSK